MSGIPCSSYATTLLDVSVIDPVIYLLLLHLFALVISCQIHLA